MLRAELGRRWPDRLRDQHARAARWFETADDSTSALEHWLAAAMPREALRLLADLAVDLFDGGRGREIRRMIGEISPVLPRSDANALIEFAWCQLFVGRASFDAALAEAESVEPADGVGSQRLTILRSASAIVSGDWRRCESSRTVRPGRRDRTVPGWTRSAASAGTWSPTASRSTSAGSKAGPRSPRSVAESATTPGVRWRSRAPGRSGSRWRVIRSTRCAPPPVSGRPPTPAR